LKLKWLSFPKFKSATNAELRTLEETKIHNKRVVKSHLRDFDDLNSMKEKVLIIIERNDLWTFIKESLIKIEGAENLLAEVEHLSKQLERVLKENEQLKKEN